MRVLIVEDDPQAAAWISKGLREAGHIVDGANNGRDGLFLATTEAYDAIVLDRMLPQLDGMTVLRTLRASSITTPVIILSALGEVDDRVAGLKLGADDYLIKPFAVIELLARLEVVVKRQTTGVTHDTVLQVADLQVDLLKRTARRGSREIELKPKEFQLLVYLMRRANQVITRTMLLEGVWDYHFDPKTNVIDVQISNLRAKIDFTDPALIHTVRGAGYRLGT